MESLQLLLVLFGRDTKKSKWKIEYEYSIYKVYDLDKKLSFPDIVHYNTKELAANNNKKKKKKLLKE
jgi:hypothetical protein